ncbi:MAG: UDP-N-acetylmuramate dehydrogenase [Paludibacteraceae bacterium]|nr:UDP-N-acetylmuramate dehydrogenase [Paludibacteraceae bacterium]
MKTLEHFSLLNHNTFGVDVTANYFVEYDDTSELQQLLSSDLLKENKFFHIGGGSNLLFINDYEGVILHSQIKGISTVKETPEHTWLRAGAGENWDEFVAYCVNNQLGGAENLSLIPGEVGATPIQNIGAYGVEVKDIIHTVECIEIATGQQKTFSNKECAFGYRDSIFKQSLRNQYIICYVTYKLANIHTPNVDYGSLATEILAYNEPSIENVRKAVIAIRKRKLPEPKVLGNAGSFFMNPIIPTVHFVELQKSYPEIPSFHVSDVEIKVPAGWLIEQCGWKGKSIGKVAVHGSQALVLINKGGANGLDIIYLSDKIRESVKEKFNIDIIPEVNIIFG